MSYARLAPITVQLHMDDAILFIVDDVNVWDTDSHLVHKNSKVINPRRACAARVTVLGLSFRLSVCLSVTTFSATTRNKAVKK